MSITARRELYQSDIDAREMMYLDAWVAVLGMAKCRGWEITPGIEIYRNITREAMGRLLDIQEHGFCGVCNGAGSAAPQLVCGNCSSTGRAIINQMELALAVGATWPEFFTVWRPRILEIRAMLKIWSGL